LAAKPEGAEAEALRTKVQRMMSKGDISLILFEIETSSSDRLRKIIAIATEVGGLGGLGQPLGRGVLCGAVPEARG
jgi:hypothetical protein